MRVRKSFESVLLMFAVLLATSAPAWAGPEKMLVVANRAEWCSVCKTNGPRVMKVLEEANAGGSFQLIVNDLTSPETAKKSAQALKAAGLDKAMANNNATGVLYFFDAKTKRPLHQITAANSDEEIKMVVAKSSSESSR